MGDAALIGESLRLMGIGMGIVFCFLLLLVALLRLTSWLVLRLGPPDPGPAVTLATAQKDADVPGDIVAAIAAAVARHRSRRSRRG